MKVFAKVIVLIFTLIILIFFLQQLLVGNPFMDEVPPLIILSIFLVISILTLFKFFNIKEER